MILFATLLLLMNLAVMVMYTISLARKFVYKEDDIGTEAIVITSTAVGLVFSALLLISLVF